MVNRKVVAWTLLAVAVLLVAVFYLFKQRQREGATDSFGDCDTKNQWWSKSRQACMAVNACTSKRGKVKGGRCYGLYDPLNSGDEEVSANTPMTMWENCRFAAREVIKSPKDEATCRSKSVYGVWENDQCYKCPLNWVDAWRGKGDAAAITGMAEAQCLRTNDTKCRTMAATKLKSSSESTDRVDDPPLVMDDEWDGTPQRAQWADRAAGVDDWEEDT